MKKDQLGKEISQIFERMWLIWAQKEKVLLKESAKLSSLRLLLWKYILSNLKKYKKQATFSHKSVSTITYTSTP